MVIKNGGDIARIEKRRRYSGDIAEMSLLLTSSASFFLCQKVLLDVTVRARLFIGNLTDKELEVEVAVELLVTNHVCEW